jgi:hypothetical protein
MKKIYSNTFPKIRIILKPSKIILGEVGAYAMINFKKDDVVVLAEEFQDNNTMTINEYNKLDRVIKKLVKAHSTITKDLLYLPFDFNFLRPMNYFNHSCEPNIGFNSNDDYVAIKNIKKGSELLLDYSYLNTNPDYKITCLCKSKKCRKIITGNEWKNSDFVKKNNQYFASTVRELLE